MKIPGIILVRTSSSRLPEKCLLDFEGKTVIEHVVDRAKHFGFDPVVCTTEEKADNRLVDLFSTTKTKIFRGSTQDKLLRIKDACEKFSIQSFISIDADDPFFDPELSRKSFELLSTGYDVVYPPSEEEYYSGSVGFAVQKTALNRVGEMFDTSDSEMMWAYFDKISDLKKAASKPPKGAGKIRLTLDYIEDYHLLLTVLRVLGPHAIGEEIVNLFKRNPDLYQVNWFRQTQWRDNQESSVSSIHENIKSATKSTGKFTEF
jgi:spore coat polysaccharide biosynthesis protein SpsF